MLNAALGCFLAVVSRGVNCDIPEWKTRGGRSLGLKFPSGWTGQCVCVSLRMSEE